MADDAWGLGRSLGSWTSSFSEVVSSQAPELLPWQRLAGGQPAGRSAGEAGSEPMEATTVLALVFPGGVVMAGDRRATVGPMIAKRRVDKVLPVDDTSAIAVAGAAGIAIEFARLVQVEFEHYEKSEGTLLSLTGKANRISSMLRANLGMAMQGLAVLPLFAGYDGTRGEGRVFTYDVTGGPYEEGEFATVGSGSVFARGALKKLYRADLTEDQAVEVAVEALYDAADDDSATGGPDLIRDIYPTVTVITAEGSRRLDEERVGRFARQVVDRRTEDQGHAAG